MGISVATLIAFAYSIALMKERHNCTWVLLAGNDVFVILRIAQGGINVRGGNEPPPPHAGAVSDVYPSFTKRG